MKKTKIIKNNEFKTIDCNHTVCFDFSCYYFNKVSMTNGD